MLDFETQPISSTYQHVGVLDVLFSARELIEISLIVLRQ